MIAAILALAWPAMLEQALQTVVMYADSAMVGRIGVHATAAVGLTTTFVWLTNSPLWSMGVGVLACISRAAGAKDDETVRSGALQSIWLALIIGVFFHILLKHTKFGRKVSAVGGNAETARLAGINVIKVRFITNITVSVFAAIVGIIYASRFNSAQPTIASGTELTIMASVIIGGVGLGGGFGSIIGTFLGSLLISSIKSGLVMMHVSSYWQNLVFGAILIASLYVDKYRREKLGASL